MPVLPVGRGHPEALRREPSAWPVRRAPSTPAERAVTAGEPKPRRRRPGAPPGPGTGYTVLSYLIGGMIVYGALGWLIGRWTKIPILFPVGMLVGLALALALVIFQFARH